MCTFTVTRDDVRNAASTLAHHWASGEAKTQEGVRRLIQAYPPAMRLPIVALMMERGCSNYGPVFAADFEGLLFDMADVEEAI